MEDMKEMELFLGSCTASLRAGREIWPDLKIAVFVMMKAHELAQAACAVIEEELNESQMAQLRVFIINVLDLRYENSAELCTDYLVELPPVVVDEYKAVCSILCKIYHMLYYNKVREADILLRILRNFHEVLSLINRAHNVRIEYNKMIKDTWGVLDES